MLLHGWRRSRATARTVQTRSMFDLVAGKVGAIQTEHSSSLAACCCCCCWLCEAAGSASLCELLAPCTAHCTARTHFQPAAPTRFLSVVLVLSPQPITRATLQPVTTPTNLSASYNDCFLPFLVALSFILCHDGSQARSQGGGERRRRQKGTRHNQQQALCARAAAWASFR